MSQITLNYDPLSDYSVADGKIKVYVEQLITVFKRDSFYKATFSNIDVINEFLTQITQQEIKPDLIEIFYTIGDKKIKTIVDIS